MAQSVSVSSPNEAVQLLAVFVLLAVRIALEIKEVAYTYVPVHLVKDGGEQHAAAYTAHNPMAQVPTLELSDGTMLTQSIAIIEFLEEQYPNHPNLLPNAPIERAKARSYAELINAGIQPLQNLSVLQAFAAMGQDKIAWGRQVIDKGLAALEDLTANDRSPYLNGNSPSIADLCLVPCCTMQGALSVTCLDFSVDNREKTFGTGLSRKRPGSNA